MLEFLKSTKFKIFVVVICAVMAGSVIAVATVNSSSPVTSAVGVVFRPLQKLSGFISEKLDWFTASFESAGAYKDEIERLNQKIAEYENRIAENGELEHKVKTYEAMLGVKELNRDFEFESCNIIGADSMDLFSSIILDKGSDSDITLNDPVISGNYVVGIVKKVHPTFCVVETLLNPDTKISALESKSREIAYVTTTLEFSQKGSCLLSGLSRTSSITPGGIIVTSGIGATYPKGLIIGTVSEVNESPYDLSSYAVIEPGVDLSQLEDVFVITDFAGQGVKSSQ